MVSVVSSFNEKLKLKEDDFKLNEQRKINSLLKINFNSLLKNKGTN